MRGVVASPAFLDGLASTGGLLAAGDLLACAAGILLGVAMGYNRRIYVLLEPALPVRGCLRGHVPRVKDPEFHHSYPGQTTDWSSV